MEIDQIAERICQRFITRNGSTDEKTFKKDYLRASGAGWLKALFSTRIVTWNLDLILF
jgi:hypothetical protein